MSATRVVYTSEEHIPLGRLLSPHRIFLDLFKNRELIVAYTKRQFQSTHRGAYLGVAWTVISPLIMLALYAVVFGRIFGGRFTQNASETPAEFALALFIGLAFYNCIAQALGGSPSLVSSNSAYVKTLAFPLETLAVSAVLNILINLAISLGLCMIAFFLMHGYLNPSGICLLLHAACTMLLCLGISWFLSSLSVFIRDIPAIIPPITTVLMFLSSVFFPISVVPPRIRWVVAWNPLAVINDQARACFLYGQWPDFPVLGLIFIFSLGIAVGGYCFFMKAKRAFADVI